MFKFLKRLRAEKPTPEAQALEVDLVNEAAQEPNHLSADLSAPVDDGVASIESQTLVTSTSPVSEDSEVRQLLITEPEEVDSVETEQLPRKTSAVAVEQVELPSRGMGNGIRSLFGEAVELDDLEDILLRADFGVDAAVEITESLRSAANKEGAASDAELRLLLKKLLVQKLTRSDAALNLSSGDLPYVILVVGVNGAGKTTTIGKLARWLKDGDWNVVLGAADTFRAAAVDQLGTWAERSGAKLVRPEREGQDPASVAYQAVELALREQADIAIIDTAGRLQNKKDLMDELGKIRRAVEKQAQITEVLLVIDATTGQNAMAQARAFTEVADVTGIVMTKLDGTAKGGIVYSLQEQLNLPVKLVGVGEGINDFAFFSPEEFAKGLVAYR